MQNVKHIGLYIHERAITRPGLVAPKLKTDGGLESQESAGESVDVLKARIVVPVAQTPCSEAHPCRGICTNGKRSDLSHLIMTQEERRVHWPAFEGSSVAL